MDPQVPALCQQMLRTLESRVSLEEVGHEWVWLLMLYLVPNPSFSLCSWSTMRWPTFSSTFTPLRFSASPWINRIWMDALKSPKPCYRIKPALGGSAKYFATVTRTLVQPSVSLRLWIWIFHRTKPKWLSGHINTKTCSSKCPLWGLRSWQWDHQFSETLLF